MSRIEKPSDSLALVLYNIYPIKNKQIPEVETTLFA